MSTLELNIFVSFYLFTYSFIYFLSVEEPHDFVDVSFHTFLYFIYFFKHT